MLEHFLQPELLWRRDLCSPPTVSAAGDVHAAYSEMGQTGAKKGELAVTSQAAGGVFQNVHSIARRRTCCCRTMPAAERVNDV